MAAQLFCRSSLITNSRLNSVTSPTHRAPGPPPSPVGDNQPGQTGGSKSPWDYSQVWNRNPGLTNKQKSSHGDHSVFINSIYRQGCVFVQRHVKATNPGREHLPPVLSLLLSPPYLKNTKKIQCLLEWKGWKFVKICGICLKLSLV